MQKKQIDWTEVQKLYDSGKTIVECCKAFGFGQTTAYKAKLAGKLIVRDKINCQPRIMIIEDRITELVEKYNSGSSYHELINMGFKQAELKYAKDSKQLVPRNSSEQSKIKIKKFGPNVPGKKALQELSIRQSINNSGGKCKWYEVSGQKVQGTWERDIAIKFNELGVNWTKLKTQKDILSYEINGKIRSYTPDFYLPDFDIYLEIKGYWWGNDKEKMRIVMETHADKNIVIIEKDDYKRIMQGELVWS